MRVVVKVALARAVATAVETRVVARAAVAKAVVTAVAKVVAVRAVAMKVMVMITCSPSSSAWDCTVVRSPSFSHRCSSMRTWPPSLTWRPRL